MSTENDKEKKNSFGKLSIEIDRTEEMKSLEEENARLKTQLETIATREFEAQCRKYGLDPESTSPDALKAVQQMHEQAHSPPRGGDTAPLNDSQVQGKTVVPHAFDEIPISMMEFESEKQMVEVLKAIQDDKQDPRSEKAKIALKLLAQKELSQTQEYELEGSISEWARKGNKAKPVFKKVERKAEEVE